MEKIGLVLEGGGSKGAYQVGVLKALLENGYRFDAVTGTSIGALNGAILAQDGLDRLEDFWREVKISSIFDVSEEIAEKLENGVSRNVMVYILLQVRNLKKFIDVNGEKMESRMRVFTCRRSHGTEQRRLYIRFKSQLRVYRNPSAHRDHRSQRPGIIAGRYKTDSRSGAEREHSGVDRRVAGRVRKLYIVCLRWVCTRY